MNTSLWRTSLSFLKDSYRLTCRTRGLLLIPSVALVLQGCGGSDDGAPPFAATYSAESDTVSTTAGTVSATLDSSAAVRIFKAIPYAAAPVGALRWQAPQPPIPWTGTRKSNGFSAACMQSAPTVLTSILYTNSPPLSENCLYLNVWTPASDASDTRPVMVLFQGGANASGSASHPTYDGAGLARKGVVVVTFNYRLGVFGWLAHPELTAESPNKASSNYALLDQLAVLRWIQANIAAFGGDRGNVTVYSQSAGAQDVNTLMASPLAAGLIHKVVLESGLVSRHQRQCPYPGGGRTSRRRICRDRKDGQLGGIARMSATDLQAISNTYFPAETVDGYVLPDQVDRIFRAGQALDIPVIAGSNSDDQTAFPPGFASTLAAFQTLSNAAFGASSAEVQSLYNVTDDASAAAARFVLPEDFQSSWQPYTLVRTMAAKYKSNAYLYLFNRVPPYFPDQINYTEAANPTALGAYHTLEQVYFYNNLTTWPRPYTDTDLRLADITSTYLVNFATTGDPNSPGATTPDGNALPIWPVFSSKEGQLMVLGDLIAPAAEPHQAALDLFDNVFVQSIGRPLAFQ